MNKYFSKKSVLLCFVLIFTFSLHDIQAKPTKPILVFNLDYADLMQIKKQIKRGKADVKSAYLKLIQEADSISDLAPLKVTDGDIPPTGNPHDFFTIGKYAFPNPKTKDGMPYIRKDGVTNPEARTDKYDLYRYEQTVARINTLSLAWFYTENEEYAAKAATFIRVWFLDAHTRMNPNFECAAALPGVYNGMAIGIIFGAQLVNFLDHIQLLRLSESWSEADNEALKNWVDMYISWLQTSKFGLEISRSPNNMGSWYSAQIAAGAIYTGNIALAKQTIETAKKQLAEQIAVSRDDFPDGSFPHEIKRNQSFLYSLFGLEAFCALAGCAEVVGMDLWHFKAENGSSMRMAFDFLTPYLSGQKEWTFKSLTEVNKLMPKATGMVRQAVKAYNTKELRKVHKYLRQYVDIASSRFLVVPYTSSCFSMKWIR